MRRAILAVFACFMLQGCSGSRELMQDDWPDYREDRDGCSWHSPEAHENANAKGYRLECEE